MPEPARAMGVCTVACLVLVVGYSVTLGASGLLWTSWVVLGLCAAGVALTGARRG
ncbi:hypothetical protein [Streptomyces sp. HPF1205]|jgi:hypothetical protein|uniref:hypothetical protein n=1 Tax=Streptomyces sp. HPF1205 TaxID=2873262 RepID=UPI001CED562F|nr:hypothetical protein [Streptomyces sp. HPF1205]